MSARTFDIIVRLFFSCGIFLIGSIGVLAFWNEHHYWPFMSVSLGLVAGLGIVVIWSTP